VARVDLDLLRVGVEARSPVDDGVAAGMDCDGIDIRVERRRELVAKARAALAVSAQSTFARIPLMATWWPRRRSQRRIIVSDASPAMNPGMSRTGGASSLRRAGRRAFLASSRASSPL